MAFFSRVGAGTGVAAKFLGSIVKSMDDDNNNNDDDGDDGDDGGASLLLLFLLLSLSDFCSCSCSCSTTTCLSTSGLGSTSCTSIVLRFIASACKRKAIFLAFFFSSTTGKIKQKGNKHE